MSFSLRFHCRHCAFDGLAGPFPDGANIEHCINREKHLALHGRMKMSKDCTKPEIVYEVVSTATGPQTPAIVLARVGPTA